MDERIITVLKAVAYGELCSDDGDNYCPYHDCEAWNLSAKYDNPVHDATCTVTLARQVLSELGMPLLLYRVEYEQASRHSTNSWIPVTLYRLAFSEQEIREMFYEDTDLEDRRTLKRRNIQVTVIGEAQEVLRKEAQAMPPETV